jgi:hypothetical protein
LGEVGRPRNLVRRGGRELVTIEEFVKQEEVTGEYGGQFASFEWVWSPMPVSKSTLYVGDTKITLRLRTEPDTM